jgi:hypothetical protein
MSGRIDTSSLFGEINKVFKRYGLEKGLGFVPDRLEISMKRISHDGFALTYREFFTYLPLDVMEVATGNAVEFLDRLGVPPEKITRLANGVEVTLEGDAKIAYFPVLEMLIQDREIAQNIEVALEAFKGSIASLLELFDFNWDWSPEAEEKWKSNIARLSEIIEANPEIESEIKVLVNRYSVQKPKS